MYERGWEIDEIFQLNVLRIPGFIRGEGQTQKEPLPNGAQFASWFRKEAFPPHTIKSGDNGETEAVPRRADMPTGAASS